MKISPKTIIFDFDGVLVDTHKDIALAANYILTQAGLDTLPPEIIKSYIGNGPVVLMQRCLGEKSAGLLDTLAPAFDQRYKAYPFAESTLYPGVMDVLNHYYKQGKSMAIATQKSGPMTRIILEKLGVSVAFSAIVGSDSVQNRKPHPESLLKILKQTQTPAGQALMIGDVPSDILAGKAAGTLTCAVTYGFGKPTDLEKINPDITIHDIKELLDWVE
jgi:phosphoglycolate phosphatase